MSVETRSTLKETVNKTVSKNGAVFFALFSFSSLLFFVAVESRAAATAATGPLEDVLPTPFVEPGALAFPMPRTYAVVLAFLSLFIGSYFAVIATRVFVNGYDGIPKEAYAENVGKVTFNMFLGTLAFAPLFIGGLLLPALFYVSSYGFSLSPLLVVALVLGVVPCAFVAVSFAFYVPYTTVEQEDFIESFSLSWEMTSGNRLGLCGFFFVFLFVLLVVAVVGLGAYVFLWNVSTLFAQLMLGFGGAAVLVFTLSLVATIYRKHHSLGTA
ncbi:MAG: hypothetical protein ACLFR5_04245 [Halobacteriales archaeon]